MHFSPAGAEKDAKADEAYFDSYGYFDIHRTMLGDEVRHHSLPYMANFTRLQYPGADGMPAGLCYCDETCADMLLSLSCLSLKD